jgi:hypothetical protein
MALNPFVNGRLLDEKEFTCLPEGGGEGESLTIALIHVIR